MQRWDSSILHTYTARVSGSVLACGGAIKATHRRCISDTDIRSLPQEQQIHAAHGGLGRVRVLLCQRTDVSLQHLPAMLPWVEKHRKVGQALGKQWQSLSPSSRQHYSAPVLLFQPLNHIRTRQKKSFYVLQYNFL